MRKEECSTCKRCPEVGRGITIQATDKRPVSLGLKGMRGISRKMGWKDRQVSGFVKPCR